jgi:hypothetical protein
MQIEFVDRYGYIGGGTNTNITGFLMISIFVPYGKHNTQSLAYYYADKLSLLFNFWRDGTRLKFDETKIIRLGQVDTSWYQLNTVTDFEYKYCTQN